jgi:hypothetical protein
MYFISLLIYVVCMYLLLNIWQVHGKIYSFELLRSTHQLIFSNLKSISSHFSIDSAFLYTYSEGSHCSLPHVFFFTRDNITFGNLPYYVWTVPSLYKSCYFFTAVVSTYMSINTWAKIISTMIGQWDLTRCSAMLQDIPDVYCLAVVWILSPAVVCSNASLPMILRSPDAFVKKSLIYIVSAPTK